MIDGIVNAIVRPPRATYTSSDLGPVRVRHRGVEYRREDFTVNNCRGYALTASLWTLMSHEVGDPECCIIYLHPNSGSKADAVRSKVMSIAAQTKVSACSFDFTGCGHSDGQYISLGVNEKEDLCAVLTHLISIGFRRFVIWGRSMGAATACMFYGAYKDLLHGTIVGIILDSSFTSFHGIANEYSMTRISVPGLLVSPVVQYLRHVIISKHGFDIQQLSPLAAAPYVNVPTLVLSAQEDKIVPPSLSGELYNEIKGPKIRLLFRGGHNTHRPSEVNEAIRILVSGAMRGFAPSVVIKMIESVVQCEDAIINGPVTLGHSTHEEKVKKPTMEKESKPTSNSKIQEAEKTSRSEYKKSISEVNVENLSILSKSPDSFTEDDIVQTLNISMHMNSSKRPFPLVNILASDSPGEENESGNEASRDPSRDPSPNTSKHDKGNAVVEVKESKEKEQQQSAEVTPIRRNVFAIHVDITASSSFGGVGKLTPQNSVGPDSMSWMTTIGSFFMVPSLFGESSHSQEQPPPPGSLGYFMSHIPNDMSPPDPKAWEELLLARTVDEILMAVVDQTFRLGVGLLEALPEQSMQSDAAEFETLGGGLIPPSTPMEDRSLVLSMTIAQLLSDMGMVSIGGEETLSWGSLIGSSTSHLEKIAHRGLTTSSTKRLSTKSSRQPGSKNPSDLHFPSNGKKHSKPPKPKEMNVNGSNSHRHSPITMLNNSTTVNGNTPAVHHE